MSTYCSFLIVGIIVVVTVVAIPELMNHLD